MKTPTPSKAKGRPVLSRLGAPTTLAYELGAIAFATLAAPVILLGFKVMSH